MLDRLTSPAVIQEYMKKHKVRFSKSLGQNFIVDDFIIDEIVRRAFLDSDDCVIEIGPGIGVLTRALADTVDQVLAIELDTKLIPVLNDTLREYNNIDIINNDVLKVDIDREIEERFADQPVKVVANLPYYITTPIIMKLLEQTEHVDEIIVMVQKEVAERMVAPPGSKTYGALSVAVQYYTDAMKILDVPRSKFMPAPNVDSAVVKLIIRKEQTFEIEDEDFFFAIVKAAFGMRRKTVANAISKSKLKIEKKSIISILEKLEINPRIRAEKLSVEQFITLSNLLKNAQE